MSADAVKTPFQGVDYKPVPGAYPAPPHTPYDSTQFEAGVLIKPAPATLESILIFNNSGSDAYFQLHDVAAVPDDGQTPKLPFVVLAGKSELFTEHQKCVNGIYICMSSQPSVKEIAGNDFWFNAKYK